MEIIDVINARTSIRRYKKSSSVGEDIIQNLVALGMRAPSPKNRQPWQVVHVTGVEKKHFVNLGFQVLEQYKERKEHFGSLEISLKAMQTASDLLFVYNPYDHLSDYAQVWEKSDLQAIGAFIEHILVSALHIITPRMRCASPQRILSLADSSPGIADGVRLPILTSAVSAFRSPAHAARALYTAGARPR